MFLKIGTIGKESISSFKYFFELGESSTKNKLIIEATKIRGCRDHVTLVKQTMDKT